MNINPRRILIVGAGVIGSLYALRFVQSGMDVTMLARGKRLEVLQRNGLRYYDNGTIRQLPVKTISKLADNDIYDFIFVPVRYDQAEATLSEIRQNQSTTIVTLINTVGYEPWLEIVGDRLLPAFPGAGGDLKGDVLHAQFGSKTYFGEINGQESERVKELAGLLETADLKYEILVDMHAFHVSHAALAAVNKHFYTDDGMVDPETARSERILSKLAADIKQNIRLVEQAGIKVIPAETKSLGDLPEKEIISQYRQMLSDDFVIDVKLGNKAISRKAEILLLDEHLHKKLSNVAYYFHSHHSSPRKK
ncbi:ketopantoate reductase family protein [Paenibacillus sp. JNUCC31]|uniref:ketopantoate reductase family protein n=1 Tax=Paenibacillus sp. JNUCC-31 TaxID=2777983 RepID=UPI00177CE934|nr:ketopantoate reductase family protein [Paenibacillus sp. JNUCC-31]QOS79594.1 ketopantoate reductase family protein [Paenibacillus sp. JNUCC-31]